MYSSLNKKKSSVKVENFQFGQLHGQPEIEFAKVMLFLRIYSPSVGKVRRGGRKKIRQT